MLAWLKSLLGYVSEKSVVEKFREDLKAKQRYLPQATACTIDYERFKDILEWMDNSEMIVCRIHTIRNGIGFYFDGIRVFSNGLKNYDEIIWGEP